MPMRRCSRTPTAPMTSTSAREPPDGKESNWVQTVPGKGWHMLFRLYGPEQAWFDKTWRPSEVELVE